MPVPPADRLKRYLTIILRWLSITIAVFVLALLSGRYITENLLHKVYTARAQIQIRVVTDKPLDPTAVQAEIEMPEVLLPVIYDLGLDKAWAKRLDKSDSDALPSPDALLPQDALAYMHKILKLDVKHETNIIDIAVSSDNPKEAADIVNAIADRYKTLRDTEEDQRNNRGLDSLRDQIAEQQKVVDEKKAAEEKMRQDQSPPYLDAQRQFGQNQSLLDALNVRLKQIVADRQLQQSPVRIISRAEIPTVPTKPNQKFCFIVTILAAGLLSIMVASFIEMMLLVARASERPEN